MADFLAAKIEFSYGVGQTVNLLSLRLQWFRIHSYPKPLPEPFFKWLVLIRPSLAGFDSTTDRKVRSSRAISAQIQLVEIAKALSYDAQIVIMEQGQSISELEALDRGYSPAGGTGQ